MRRSLAVAVLLSGALISSALYLHGLRSVAALAFIDGRVSEESYREEHELAYQQMKKHETETEVKTDDRNANES